MHIIPLLNIHTHERSLGECQNYPHRFHDHDMEATLCSHAEVARGETSNWHQLQEYVRLLFLLFDLARGCLTVLERKKKKKGKKKNLPSITRFNTEIVFLTLNTIDLCVSHTIYVILPLKFIHFNYCSMYSTGGTVCTLIGWFIQLRQHRRDTLSWMQMRSIHQTMSTTTA